MLGDVVSFSWIASNETNVMIEPFDVVLDPLSSPDFSLYPGEDCGSRPLAPGQNCNFTVRFVPSEAGLRRLGNLELRRNGLVLVRSSMAATGVAPNQLPRIWPPATSFSRVPLGTSLTEELRIQLPPGAAAVQAITVDGRNAADFIVDRGDCDVSLPADGFCYVNVEHRPSAAGWRIGRLVVKTGTGNAYAGLAVRGI